MLKEIFVIEDGINVFHYVSHKSSNPVDPVLTSGFLSALQSFTSHSRASQISSYNSETEMVIFKKIQNTQKDLVAIFSIETNNQIAETLISRIDKIIARSKIIYEHNADISNTKGGRKIADRIKKLIELSSSKQAQIANAEQIFDKHNANFVSIYDIKNEKSIYRKSNSRMKQGFARRLIELDTNLNDFIAQIDLGEDYSFVTIESANNKVSFYKSNHTITISQCSSSSQDAITLPLKINGYDSSDEYIEEYLYLSEVAKWRMEADNSFNTLRGDPPYWRAEQACSNLVEKFSEFMYDLFNDSFFKIQIHLSNPKLIQITILKQHMANSHEFTIYKDLTSD